MEHETDIDIERKAWSKCFICESDYSSDIRMNDKCFHSYCKECIEESATTSMICPICHTPLPSPLSSLPINHSLKYWLSISPPFLRFFFDIAKEEKAPVVMCAECAEREANVFCSSCDASYCDSCSSHIHNLKVMSSHSIHPASSPPSSLPSLPTTSLFLNYFRCDIHEGKDKKLFCVTCNECVCTRCISESHGQHSVCGVATKVQEIKMEWMENVEFVSNEYKSKLRLHMDRSFYRKNIQILDEEIHSLEEKLVMLKEKRKICCERIQVVNQMEESIDQRTQYLSNFLLNLPSLPLSTFLSPSGGVFSVVLAIKGNRVKDFFEKQSLSSLYSFNSNYDLNYQYFSKYTEDEKCQRINSYTENQIELISLVFPKEVKNPQTFHSQVSIASRSGLMSSIKDNALILSDFRTGAEIKRLMSNQRSIFDSKIIPSLKIVVISNSSKKMVEIFDISGVMEYREKGDIVLSYSIGKGNYIGRNPQEDKAKDPFYINPGAIGFSEGKSLLAVVDIDFTRITIFKISQSICEGVHSVIKFPNNSLVHGTLDISSDGNLLVCYSEGKVKLFKWNDGMDISGQWEEDPPLNLNLSLNIMGFNHIFVGVAFHSFQDFLTIGIGGSNSQNVQEGKIIFYKISTREQVFTFFPRTSNSHPSYPSYSNPGLFGQITKVSIDEDLIAVTDQRSCFVFKAPLFV